MKRLFTRRFRGFKVVEIAAAGVLIVLMLGVYMAKTSASRDSNAIRAIERQIAQEKASIRMLQADVSALEAPERIEQLSSGYLGLGPVKSGHEKPVEDLPVLASGAGPRP